MENKLRLEWRTPAELKDNPQNWKTHPPKQLEALKSAINNPEIGWAGVALFNEATGHLLDGHARKKVTGDNELMPVLIGSWSEEAERIILLTLDPLKSLAIVDKDALANLIDSVTTDDSILSKLINSLDPRPAEATTEEITIPESWQLIVACKDESDQLALIERLTADGYQTKALIG